MSDEILRELAQRAGIHVHWTDNDGVQRTISAESLRLILDSLGVPASGDAQARDSRARLDSEAASPALPLLHTTRVGETSHIRGAFRQGASARVEFEDGGAIEFSTQFDVEGALVVPPLERAGYHSLLLGDANINLAIAPQRCFTIDDAVSGQNVFGITTQTYGLRSADAHIASMGSGDFGALAELAKTVGQAGADAVGISPAHALFSGDLNHYSPYSPSSRFFLNVLLADPHAAFDGVWVREAIQSAGLVETSAQLEKNKLIDWPQTGAARLALLRALFALFEMQHMSDALHPLAQDFAAFRASGGVALEQHGIFEVLHAQQFARDFTKWHWRSWPAPLRDVHSPAVAALAREQAREVTFHIFAQWLAVRSLAYAQDQAKRSGMRIGLINDLAVGLNAGGSHAWSRPDDLLPGLAIGAPPDALAPRGQNWGLTTFSPRALVQTGYAPFIETLRSGLRHAGGLRIDHVMGLARLWLIPEGAASGEGAYVSYPCDDLLRLIALESSRHRAIVIGEDLGTVPPGFRAKLSHNGMAGLRVLLFERNWEGWYRPDWYPREAVAMTSTHDTATFAGWRAGRDIEVRGACGQLPPGQSQEAAQAQRTREIAEIERAFGDAGVSGGAGSQSAIAFLAKTASQMVLVPLEDMAGQIEQPNLPGTVDEHPNWRRRYVNAELMDAPEAANRLAMLANRKT